MATLETLTSQVARCHNLYVMGGLQVQDQDPINIEGRLNSASYLELYCLGNCLSDYEFTLDIRHEEYNSPGGLVRVAIHDFQAEGDLWTVYANHLGYSWSRDTSHSYFDFSHSAAMQEIDVSAISGQQTRSRKIWVRTRPTNPFPDGEPSDYYQKPTGPRFEWLGELYRLVKNDSIDPAIDLLFDKISQMIEDEDFSDCDQLIRVIDTDQLDTNLLVAVLSVTLPVSNLLLHRRALIERVEKRLLDIAPERLDNLLSGLR